MKIAILDYNTTSVMIKSAPNMESSDEIEDWIESHLGFNMDEISWMSADHMDIKIEV